MEAQEFAAVSLGVDDPYFLAPAFGVVLGIEYFYIIIGHRAHASTAENGTIEPMRLVRFVIAGAIGLSTNLLILHLLVQAGMYYLYASIIAVSLSTIVGFLLQRKSTCLVPSPTIISYAVS